MDVGSEETGENGDPEVVVQCNLAKKGPNLEVSRGNAKLIGKSSLDIPQYVKESLPKFDTAFASKSRFNILILSFAYSYP